MSWIIITKHLKRLVEKIHNYFVSSSSAA